MALSPLLLVALLAAHDPAPAQDAAPQQRPPVGRSITEKTIPVPKGARLTLNSDAGEIVIKTWDRDAVSVRASHSSRMQVTAELKDQVLVIGATSGRAATSVDYELTVPAWIGLRVETRYSGIEIEGVSGSVSVESIQGDISLRNLGGPVFAKSIEGGVKLDGGRGKVQITTVQGDVTITKTSGDITAETNDGDITLADVQASTVSASTVDGEIKFSGALSASGQYEFTSHDGEIVLTIPENSNATFGVRTYSDENQVHTTFPLKTSGQVRKGRRVTYTLGTGSAQVELETFDGSFYLRKPGEAVKKEGPRP
jgi:DUF4097 and DUF4098 domain-containing protein YvlB